MKINSNIVIYLKKIDATLEPFEGRFLVHGKQGEVVEGESPGQVVIIEFPDLERARAWHQSDAYQKILPLRANNADCSVVIIEGVPQNYRASDLIGK